MGRLLDILRIADWLHAGRARTYVRILFFTTAAIVAALIGVSLLHGGLDPRGEPLGTDFASFWAASKLALEGHPLDAWRTEPHHAAQTAIFGRDTGYAAFFYPPVYLLVCLPLAALPYLPSLLAWLAVTGAAYARAARAWMDERLGWLAIGAFPAVFSNIGHGQNGFLSGALMGLGALWLDRRPWLSGVMFGAMIWKPHLGLVIPFALLAARRWKTIAAAAVTALTLVALSAAVFGLESWRAFLDASPLARATLEQGLVDPAKMQSAFAAVRVLGGPLPLAWGLQALVALAAVGALVWLQLRVLRTPAEGAALLTAALLASPFLLDYDLTLLIFPLAWLATQGVRDGFRPWEKTLILVAFVLPVLSRSLATFAHLPIAPVVIGLVFLMILRRAAAGSPPVP